MTACRGFAVARQTATISNTWGYAPICSDLGISAQKCPKSEVAVRFAPPLLQRPIAGTTGGPSGPGAWRVQRDATNADYRAVVSS
jgi:hypothetical protein